MIGQLSGPYLGDRDTAAVSMLKSFFILSEYASITLSLVVNMLTYHYNEFIYYPANRYWEYSTYQVEVVILIWNQILVTNLQGNVLQPEGRINNQILWVNRSNRSWMFRCFSCSHRLSRSCARAWISHRGVTFSLCSSSAAR